MPTASIRSRRLRSPVAFVAYLATCGLGAIAISSASGCGSEAEASQDDAASVAAAEAEIDAQPAVGTASSGQGVPKYDARESLAPMIEAVGPAVVSIRAHGKPIGPRLPSQGPEGEGKGSGFLLEEDGIVVTNNHVVEGARSLEVRLADGRTFDAEVLGSDEATDLAVLGLDGAEGLPTVTLGESSGLRVGDWVVAIGSPMGLEHSASVGIVSGRGRGSLGLYRDSYLDFLQTDADIAPGSSGGPLFDLSGHVVGIATAVGAGGPGFAIPIDQAEKIIVRLREDGRIVRGWLGAASVPDEDGGQGGARIGKVFAGTPAAHAGLREGDLVVELDGAPIDSFDELRARIAALAPGHTVLMAVRRGDDRVELAAVLSERPRTDALQRLRPARPSAKPPSFLDPFSSPSRRPARLGIRARATDDGLEVVGVEPGSLAHELDLKPGDILRRLDGVDIREPADVRRALSEAGTKLEAELLRGGVPHHVTLERS